MTKTKIGTIVSDKMINTAVILISRMEQHPLYKKKYRVSKRIKAHNPDNKFKTGDIVVIRETKPISKEKSWEIVGLSDSSKGGKQ